MLSDSLKVLLASSYVFAIKAQNFHWNIEGPNFPQYHEFFGKLYEEVNDNAIDQCAEHIRTLDVYTPASLTRFNELSIIDDQVKIPRAELMFEEIYVDNQKISELLVECFNVANQANKQGIANFIAERQAAHDKHGWMLRSILKKTRQ